MLTAQADADKIRFIGEAEAASIEAVGKAEAEKMRLKAEAYQQYGEAAKIALVLEALPKVCSAHTGFSWRNSLWGISPITEETHLLRSAFSTNIFYVFRLLPRWLHHCPEPMRLSF